MQSVKSLKYLQPSRTQKLIKEELQKQDFFQNLINQVQQKFKAEEYQYLINYVIPKRNETREYRRPLIHRRKNYYSSHSKENVFASCLNKPESPKRLKPTKSFQQPYTSTSSERIQSFHKPATTKSGTRVNVLTKKVSSNQQMTAITDTQNKTKTNTIKKFKEISFIENSELTLKHECELKLKKKSSKAMHQKLLSHQNVRRNYKDNFLSDIMKVQAENEEKNRFTDIDFQQQQSITRKTHQPENSFWEKEKELESKYRHFTSIRFQTPQKKSRSRLKVYNRKF